MTIVAKAGREYLVIQTHSEVDSTAWTEFQHDFGGSRSVQYGKDTADVAVFDKIITAVVRGETIVLLRLANDAAMVANLKKNLAVGDTGIYSIAPIKINDNAEKWYLTSGYIANTLAVQFKAAGVNEVVHFM
jgi:hypothetical protein